MKKSGIATVLGLSLIALITGQSLGLKWSGSYIVRAAKINPSVKKADKLTPAKKIESNPWTKIQKAMGKSIIFAGEHIYIIIGTTVFLLYKKNNRGIKLNIDNYYMLSKIRDFINRIINFTTCLNKNNSLDNILEQLQLFEYYSHKKHQYNISNNKK